MGSFHEPTPISGLAHFLEHMLFKGSKKYPNPYDFTAFIGQNSGYFNAFTSQESTSYVFSMAEENFEGAMDRFSRFFIDPLFDPTAIEKEISAVNSEFFNTLTVDMRLLLYGAQVIASPEHPFSRNLCRNSDTLKKIPAKKGLNLVNELNSFYKQFSSSHLMS